VATAGDLLGIPALLCRDPGAEPGGCSKRARGDVELLGAAAAATGLSGFARRCNLRPLDGRRWNSRRRASTSALGAHCVRQLMRLQPHLKHALDLSELEPGLQCLARVRPCRRQVLLYQPRHPVAGRGRTTETAFQPELAPARSLITLQHKIGQSDETNTFRSLFSAQLYPTCPAATRSNCGHESPQVGWKRAGRLEQNHRLG